MLGDTVTSSQPGDSLSKEEFGPEVGLFLSTEVNLGYPGIQADASSSDDEVYIPDQKPQQSKKNLDPPLTRQHKREYRRIWRIRILVDTGERWYDHLSGIDHSSEQPLKTWGR